MSLPGFTIQSTLGRPRFVYTTASAVASWTFRYASVSSDAGLRSASPPQPICPGGTVCCEYDSESRTCIGGCCGNPGACCPDGKPGTGNRCANLKADPTNCGRCGNACPSGTTCSNGTCTSNCPPGQSICGNKCVNLNQDPLNCGRCGNVCTTQGCCNATCINLSNNNQNCGACGNVCPADRFCAGSQCVCRQGVDCNGTCTNTGSDPNNCGSCGQVCVGGTCTNGACICRPGFTNCNDHCVLTGNDPNNCGTCGHKCPSGMVCNAGFCESISQSSSTVCDPNSGQCSTTNCTNFDGECTGLNGPRRCVTAPGVPLKCCSGNIFFGEHPWVHVCTTCTSDRFGRCTSPPVDLAPSQGCGVCY